MKFRHSAFSVAAVLCMAFVVIIVPPVLAQPAGGGPGGAGSPGGMPPPGAMPQTGGAPGAVPGGTTGSGASGIQGAAGRQGGGRLFLTAAPETRTTTVRVAGRLEPARRITHTVGVAGLVQTVHVAAGARVAEGQALATVVRDAPGESYRPVVVTARLAGVVSDLPVSVGQELKSGATIATVIDNGEYSMSVALSDRDAFRVGEMTRQQAGRGTVSAHSADGTVVRGYLTGISAEPDYATGLFRALLRFPAQTGARVGVVLFVDLPVESVRGVFVPQTLVVRRFGRSMLWTVDAADTLRLVQIVAGKPFGDDIVVTGLQPGTRILSRVTGYEKEGLALAEYSQTLRKGS